MGLIKKAVIPVAGMGTRFLPATKSLPKEMLPIIDTPIILYVVKEAIESGIDDIILITSRGKRAIEDFFDQSVEVENFLQNKGQLQYLDMVRKISKLADIHYIRQKEPKGLGHAVLKAKNHIGQEPFALLLGDEIFQGPLPATKQLMDCYQMCQASTIAVRPVERDQVSKYGIIKPRQVTEHLTEILALIEKPAVEKAPSNLAIVGRYIIEPEIFEILERQTPGYNGEIQLTDALQTLKNKKKIYAFELKGKRYDVGDQVGYLKALIEFSLERDDLKADIRNYLKELKI